MKGNKILWIAFAFVALLSISMASALPNVDYVKLNGDVHESGDTLVVERGEDVTVKIKLQADVDEENVVIEAQVMGYEYNDKDRSLNDYTPTFDMQAGDTEYQTLNLAIPIKAEKDYYDLRVRVSSRTGSSIEYLFNLRVEGSRHDLEIRDVILHPSSVEAGSSLLVNARVTNRGEKDETDVKVTARIKSLGIEDSDYISSLDADESKTSEELFLRVPACTTPGNYELEVVVEYDEGYETTSTTEVVEVAEGKLCNSNSDNTGRTIVSVGKQNLNIVAGQEATYSIALTNAGSEDRIYTIGVSGVDSWASYKITPGATNIVKAGETSTVFISVMAKDNAKGQQSFIASISSGDETQPIQFNAVVEGKNNVRQWAEFVLIALVILLVVLGLIIGFSRMRSKEDGDDEELSGQTYY